MPSAVVTTETAFAAALIGRSMRGDFQCRGRILFVAAADRVAGHTIAVGVTDVRFVCELRGKRFARPEKHWRIVRCLLRMANNAAGFLRGLLIAARRRMADVTFVVRGNAEQGRFRRLLVTEIAIRVLPVRQFVRRVRFVLFGVEEGVEIISARKIALRRARRQPLSGVVANRAGLLRFGDELLDVAFDAGFVTRKFQLLLLVAVSGRNQVFHQIALVMAGIAFQFVRLRSARRHFDHAQMRLMREFLVVDRSGLRRNRRGRRRRFRLLSACRKRIEKRQTRRQTAESKHQFYFFHPHRNSRYRLFD